MGGSHPGDSGIICYPSARRELCTGLVIGLVLITVHTFRSLTRASRGAAVFRLPEVYNVSTLAKAAVRAAKGPAEIHAGVVTIQRMILFIPKTIMLFFFSFFYQT